LGCVEAAKARQGAARNDPRYSTLVVDSTGNTMPFMDKPISIICESDRKLIACWIMGHLADHFPSPLPPLAKAAFLEVDLKIAGVGDHCG
jgi:hypothetical protein